MKKILLSLALATVSATLCLPSLAQDDPLRGRWWTIPAVVERLDLSAKQVEAIEEVALSTQEQIIDFKSDGDKAQLRLRRLLEAEELDEAAIETALARVSDAQCSVSALHNRYRFEIAKILSKQQRAKLSMAFADREQRQRRQRLGGRRR